MGNPDDGRPAEPPPAVEHEFDAETPPSIAVVRAISALEGIDPMNMPAEGGFVLSDHIDPAALDALLATGTGEGSTVVTFEITAERTYLVDLSDTGRIIVRRASTA